MGKNETYNRNVNIWINGKEVKNDIASIRGEWFKLNNELKRTTIGTEEYKQKAEELKRVDGILRKHQEEIKSTGSAWNKVKGFFSSAQGIVLAGAGVIYTAFQSIKNLMTSTGDLSDRLDVTLAGWRGGIDAIRRSMADLDFKEFGRKIKEAIDEGRRYAENLDDIDDKTRALRIAEAEARNELIDQKKIQNDVNKSLTERSNAGKRVIEIEENLARIRTGIAQQAYENELDNITSIAFNTNKVNDSMREQVLLYLKRDKDIIARVENGKKYAEIQKQITEEQAKQFDLEMSPEGVAIKKENMAITKKLGELNKEILKYKREDYELYKTLTIPTDEKYSELTQKIVDLEGAKASAKEDTLRISSKDAKITKELTEENKKYYEMVLKMRENVRDVEIELANYFQELKEKRSDSYKQEIKDLDDIVATQREKHLTDLQNRTEIESTNALAQIELEKQINEIRRRNEISEAEKTGADISLINQKYAKLDADLEFKKNQTKLQMAAGFFANMSTIFGKQTALGKAAAAVETTINTYASATAAYKAMAGIPVVGPALGIAAAAAAVAAGLQNVKQILAVNTKKLYTGGYSGGGGKYAIAGVTHGGEWTASSEMVTSPVTGPIIAALEEERRRSFAGYANSGQPGSNGPGGAGSAGLSPLMQTDPELKALLRQNAKLYAILIRDGVSTRFGYKDIDNIREGMNKLEQIEGDASMG